MPPAPTDEQIAYALRAEDRSLRQGCQADGHPDDGTYTVPSTSVPDVTYQCEASVDDTGTLWVGCSCPSGEHRPGHPIPCKHGATVARRLEVDGLVKWDDIRGWTLTAALSDAPSAPIAPGGTTADAWF